MNISSSFFEGTDVVYIAERLIGFEIETTFEDVITRGIISETEAYRAPEDKASHAYNGRRTARTETMYGPSGLAYVYLCYGIHHLFNIVTGPADTPHAVLIRGVIPTVGIETMKRRRSMSKTNQLTNGPGKWTQAFGITTAHNGTDLVSDENKISLHAPSVRINENDIQASARVGIGYAEEWIDKPWRFSIRANETRSR